MVSVNERRPRQIAWKQVCAAFLGVLVLSGCQQAYFSALESVGYHKRDLLVGRVEAARDAQESAKEQFTSALDQFSNVVNFQGGELEATYKRLDGEFERSEAAAEAVRDRIRSVESVAEALFKEWATELDQYTNADLRRASELRMDETRARYDRYIFAMHRAEKRMDPVLGAFRDQVLYLKHNLNARAVASIQSELQSVESDIAALIREMEGSIAEANSFIGDLSQG